MPWSQGMRGGKEMRIAPAVGLRTFSPGNQRAQACKGMGCGVDAYVPRRSVAAKVAQNRV